MPLAPRHGVAETARRTATPTGRYPHKGLLRAFTITKTLAMGGSIFGVFSANGMLSSVIQHCSISHFVLSHCKVQHRFLANNVILHRFFSPHFFFFFFFFPLFSPPCLLLRGLPTCCQIYTHSRSRRSSAGGTFMSPRTSDSTKCYAKIFAAKSKC